MRRLSGVTADALFLELRDLVDQRLRIDHHAVADDGELAPAHHARGQQRQLVGRAVDHQRMAGIVAALEADDDVGLFGQPVDDLALALVAPLGPDHYHIRHQRSSLRQRPDTDAGSRRPGPPSDKGSGAAEARRRPRPRAAAFKRLILRRYF